MIDKETIDKIFDAARIDEVVGDFVVLKKRGGNLLGLCPFHNEKTPSFTVSPAKGIYKCFGCSKGGNSVNFIMDHEQLTYPEALRYLAKKYNIEIAEEEQSPEQQQAQNERESLFVVSGYAQKYFTDTLHNSDEGKAIGLSYFRERGFRPDIIEKFQLGYSPDKRSSLVEAAKAAGYKAEYMVKAGLISTNDEGKSYYDRFSGRVMFPIHNVTGRVIAFGGRTLRTDKKVAKYVNSPETDIYHKSKVLYGIYYAKKSIIAEDNCYLVEGYTDVISMHQAGIENVVASSGTSLTVEQIRLIRRYTQNITILYDGDYAGIKASFRGIDLVLEEGMNVKVLLFPDGEDPDSYSKRVSTQELKKFIQDNSTDFVTFKAKILLKNTPDNPIEKAKLIHQIVDSIAIIPDAISRSIYVKECSRILEISEQALLVELNKARRKKLLEKKDAPPEIQDIPIEEVYEDKVKELEKPHSEKIWDEHYVSELDSIAEEKEIIRILLVYGKEELTEIEQNSEGDKIEYQRTIFELIHDGLSIDSIEFETNTYKHIYQEYIHNFTTRHLILEARDFVNHTNSNISLEVINLIAEKYSISSSWEEKHQIFTTKEYDNLRSLAERTLLALKLKKIMKMILENQRDLKVFTAESDVHARLAMHKNLSEAKVHFANLLGRVILN